MLYDAACLPDQFDPRKRGAAGRYQVINQHHFLPRGHLALVQFDPVSAIFELVIDTDLFTWQLAGFAQHQLAQPQRIAQPGRYDEPARFDTCDQLGVRRHHRGNAVDGFTKPLPIEQQR